MTFQIVGAGAGSGKTWHIQETLRAWVTKGEIRPERILAVTFTEAAASELKGRIRGALLSVGRIEDAATIERAYISTIHALGRRILTEHAFDAGLSPSLRLIEDAEAELLLRRAIAETEALEGFTENLEAHGYAWNFSGGSATDAFRRDLRAAIGRLNELGERGDDPDLPGRAAAALEADWPETEEDGARLEMTLRAAIEAMLETFPDGIVEWSTSAAATKDFTSNIRDLRKGLSDSAYTDWEWWQRLQSLRVTNRRQSTPEGYDELAEVVMEAARALPRHPGPKREASGRLERMLAGAQDVRRLYSKAKARLGVVDFGDMIARAETLLRERPEAVSAMMDGIDCVIVDEFQDTNPVQFALLAHLIEAAPRVVLVGDGKQAIMGFQGADARLAAALARQHPDAAYTMDTNRRSVPGIMNLVNDLGAGLFKDYAPLKPHRGNANGTPIEVLRMSNKASTKKGEPLAKGCHHIAERIRNLLSEKRDIADRRTGAARPLRPSDVAILCRTHGKARGHADCLAHLGIPVDLDEDGWFSSAAVTVARSALAVIADPADSFAALLYLTHGPAALPLENALTAVLDEELTEHANLEPLMALHKQAPGWTVGRVLAVLRTEGGLDDWAAGLDDPSRAHADLARLDAEAASFEEADPVTRAASGVFGWDIRSFLAWLAIRTEAGDNARPDAGAAAARGVKVSTWHAAKGLEWPVVCVTGLDWTIEERPNTLRIEFDDWDEPGMLLDRATIHYHPVVASKEVAAYFAAARREPAAVTERCLSYVAFTRARDLLVLEWPDFCKPDADTVSRLLMEEGNLTLDGGAISIGKTVHPARITSHGEIFPEGFTTSPKTAAAEPLRRPGRREVPGPRGEPIFLRPSDGGEEAALWSVETHPLGTALSGDAYGDAGERGTALHLAMRVLLTRPHRTLDLGPATGLGEDTLVSLLEQANALGDRLSERGLTDLYSELPFEAVLPNGTCVRGTTDLLACSRDGTRAAIIDFKSPAPKSPLEAARPYLAQLGTYIRAATVVWPNLRIERAGIHFLGSGTLIWGTPG
ncbi:ATP-dependent exoDNAse (exonuclease V) beta subunit (contains helicase and exonuclease domains) [Roseivivax marinus]|uniref:UvrD-helicase domain-containing protein n=1 Tax=Roseivivax marinus TaxID=1379903 RepID=UPI0008CDDACC|nr:UvrD-helicase domain-containing protein [Roseivivax marinus]SEL62746.1 ATP-dependent exoDNAse (exonuclease V) beta subunit (contains helicase and exonuclease domains) [Roseivivax marinus]